jgi:uncharacterized repeat protein (TIGR01451 family)
MFLGLTVGSVALVNSDSGRPMIEFTKTCQAMRYVGGTTTIEYNISNTGDGTAQNVVVTDVIPQGWEFLSVDNNGAREGNSMTWRLGDLGPGQQRVLKAKFRCNQIGVFDQTATITYCAKAVDSCRIEVKGIPAILLECVDDPDPIELNGSVTYTIRVLNQGTAVGTNIGIECTLPPEAEYVTSSGPTTARQEGKKITFAPLASLAPKASELYKVTVKSVGVGDVRFRVQLTSDQLTSPVMETESTHFYE